MRLIRIISILLLFIGISQSGNAQYETKRVGLSETFLEERHIRYMYNFVLNNSFFQYESGLYPIVMEETSNSPKENRKILVYDKFNLFSISSLELFLRPDSLFDTLLLVNLDYNLESIGLVSQFDIDFMKRVDNEIKNEVIHDKIFGDSLINYIVEFSNVLIRKDKIYLSIRIHLPANYDPDVLFRNYQIFEFEYCKSMGWVYPRRVSDKFFGLILTGNVHAGDIIDIPSLKCN